MKNRNKPMKKTLEKKRKNKTPKNIKSTNALNGNVIVKTIKKMVIIKNLKGFFKKLFLFFFISFSSSIFTSFSLILIL